MTDSPSAPREQAVQFGPYRIYPQQRLVLEGDQPLRLSRRPMDILLILLAHAGHVVSRQQLIAEVWPTSVVEDGNLRVHIAALRKALGDGQNGQRYIVTVAQRGYSFVAPITLSHREAEQQANPVAPMPHNLPVRRRRMIGRQSLVDNLVKYLPRKRFITLIGPGGIGKTTVALRVAELLIGRYPHGIRLLDLGPLTDPKMIVGQLAALLEIAGQDGEPLDSLAQAVGERQMLLVIDNCEHLIDAVALLCESLLRHAPHLHILATSREALRAEGEYIQRLGTLDCPPRGSSPDKTQALNYSALQLLIEGAMAGLDSFELTDDDLPLAIDICRRLDGIPLAIELAAAQINTFGLLGLRNQLESSFGLLTQGQRGNLPRQRTLRATLDWSHALLTSCEQISLRRLSAFRGSFSLRSATAVIADNRLETHNVFAAVTQLAAKSMLTVEVGEDEVFYRLLDTTRAYALEKLDSAAEMSATLERHAAFCLQLMDQAHQEWEQIPGHLWLDRYTRALDDIRATLDWGLNSARADGLVTRLVATSTPLWQELSLLKEHAVYVDKALALLELTATPDLHVKMDLTLARASLSYHAHGGTAHTVEAFVEARTLALQCNDLPGQLRAVSGHMAVNLCCGQYAQALEQSQQFDRLGVEADPVLSLSAQRLRVLALHFSGDQTQALVDAEQVIQRMAQSGGLNRFTRGFGVQYDQSVASLTILARTLWLRGFAEQAWRTANQALEVALQIKHGTSICYTLALAGCVIAQYNGHQQTAREYLQLLLDQAQKHAVQLFYRWGQQYGRHLTPETAGTGMPADGLIKELVLTLDASTVDNTLVSAALRGNTGWCTAEILRAEAERLLQLNAQSSDAIAEGLLQKALAVAREQGALAWELRAATSLARFWQRQGRDAQARDLLESVYGAFSEGFATPDLLQARQLLDELHCEVVA